MSFTLKYEDMKECRSKALEKAITDAKGNAKLIAKELNVKIIDVKKLLKQYIYYIQYTMERKQLKLQQHS